jgi:hypothetical protein
MTIHPIKHQTYLALVALLLSSAVTAHSQTTAMQTEALNAISSVTSSPTSDGVSSSAADLPDAPSTQVAQEPSSSKPAPKQDDHTRLNPIALLSPRLINGQPMTAHDKFEIYIHKTYSPAAVIYPLFGTGIKMARPNQDYPPEWQDGMGAFGRNYGDTVARRTAKTTAEFATQVIFHEDPRYARSTSTNPIVRIGHAIGWTLVDKSDSGHSMLAVSTFTGAAAGSFVGMAYLPDGFNDVNHAKSRMLGSIGGKAISNALIEFEPTWGPIARKIHIPRLLPDWWTPDHK